MNHTSALPLAHGHPNPTGSTDGDGVKPADEARRQAWLKACGDYCAPDGTCSCAKFADDPTECERRKEMEVAYGVAEGLKR